jgi:lipoprotein-releasing system permease protein
MSRLPFELLLALRYLRPKRTFVSVITLISVLGVTLGVAVLIIVISVMTGFDHQLRDKILGFNAHLRITARDSSLTNYPAMMAQVQAAPHVRGVSPFVACRVLIRTHPPDGSQPLSDAPWIRGIDPEAEARVSDLLTNVFEGSTNLDGRGILVGREFAEGMQLMVGDRVTIYSPEDLEKMEAARKKGEDVASLPDDYEVRGIFDMGYYEYNANFVLTSLENAQNLAGLGDSVHGLLVELDDPDLAGVVRQELRPQFGPNYRISLWTEENSALLDAIAVEKNVMFYILFFIMIVAALCILSALITFVVQKTREIGMLKAIGATNWQISGIFLAQSAMVGVMGVIAGYGLGMLAVHYRNEFLHFMRRATGWELFPASIYGFGDLPALVVPHDVMLICTSALVICLLGGVIPAWQAGRLKPVEALRHE